MTTATLLGAAAEQELEGVLATAPVPLPGWPQRDTWDPPAAVRGAAGRDQAEWPGCIASCSRLRLSVPNPKHWSGAGTR